MSEYHEPVFDAGSFICNNAPFTRKCIECNQDIQARSVHQKTELGCQETEIHVHKWSISQGGACIFKGCNSLLDFETLKRRARQGSPNIVK